jgi:predicted RNA-binding Zn-ribbon protein involved in translation (DUF1610 family)
MNAEAPILPCARCGVALRVDPEAQRAQCKHCGAALAIPPDVREKARAYRVEVEAELRRMGFAAAFAKGLESGAMGRLMRVYLIALYVLTGALMFGQMAPAFGFDEDVKTISLGVFLGGLALTMAIFFLSLKGAIRREMLDNAEPPPAEITADMAAARVTSVCSSCGGHVPFRMGEAQARCPYCGAAVLPTAEVRARIAEMAAFYADLEQGKSGRAHTRSFVQGAGSRAFEVIFWILRRTILVIPLIIGVALGQTFLDQAAPGRHGRRDPDAEIMEMIGVGAMAGGAIVTALLLGGSVLIGSLRKRNPRRAALERLAQRYGSRVREDGTVAALDWLDAHWAAETPEGSLVFHNSDDGKSVDRIMAAIHHRGSPVLVMFANAPHVRRFDVFVAGYDRSRAERPSSAAAIAELRSAGLRVTVLPAGIHLSLPAADPRFCEPSAAAWMLDRAAWLLEQKA